MASPTYEELQQLRAENAKLKAYLEAAEKRAEAAEAQVAALQAQVAALQAQVAALQVRWVQQAVAGAVAEADAYRRSVLTGRCVP